MMKNPSKFQTAIFDFITREIDSAIIEAVAGSGKTTTIVHALSLINRSFRILFLAFNKNIAEELQKRVPSHVMARTFHSVGVSAWQKYIGKRLEVKADKVKKILEGILDDRERFMYVSFCNRLIGLAKNAGMTYLIPDTENNWIDLINYYDLSLDSEEANEFRAIEICRDALKISINQADHIIDYDDMLFMPLIKNISFYQNDFVFVDEAQDTNMVQQALLKRMLKPRGRLIAVGDSCQAIYGFRGADSEAMNKMKEAFGAISLPLSISYRCAKSIVEMAKKYVPHIESAETAPDGKVDSLPIYDKETFNNEDAIICRNTAPLIEMAYSLISRGIGCKVLGREIGNGLINLINKMKAKGIPALINKLDKYREREMAKHMSKGNETLAGAIDDKINCLNIIINNLYENERTIPKLIEKIEALFSDKIYENLTLCTSHRSKGLEWKRVFVLDAEKYMPSKFARQKWQQVQEDNLIYVTYTRAKEELYFISSGAWKDESKKKTKKKN